jgi:hypothetical protein
VLYGARHKFTLLPTTSLHNTTKTKIGENAHCKENREERQEKKVNRNTTREMSKRETTADNNR